MKPLLAVVLILCACLGASAEEGSPRRRYNFNPGWSVMVGDPAGAEAAGFDDKGWKAVTLPYAWNEDAAFKVSIEDLPTGIAWYRKKFRVPADAAGRKVFLEFEGIRFGGEVFLNGKPIGRSDNGVMAFGFDISAALLPYPAENVLAVRTDNNWRYREKATNSGFEWNDRNFYANYGGINKNVWLHVADRLHQTLPLFSNLGTTGVYVHARDFDLPAKAATLTAEAQVRNDRAEATEVSYEAEVRELDGRVVATLPGTTRKLAAGETVTLSAQGRATGLSFWSWGYGYLYDVRTRLKVGGQVVDEVSTRTGFRQTDFSKGMLHLNGRALHLKGYAQRSTNEWPAVGQSVPPWMSDLSNGLMVASNANLVRWMHVTPQKQDVESLDRLGLIQAMPAGDAEKDVTDRRWGQRVEVMRDAIIYNRNSPSILFYESGNNEVSEAHLAEMKKLRDLYDPHGGRAVGSRNMLGSQEAEYGGEMLYVNKSRRIPFWQMEYSRDEGQRGHVDDWTPPFHKDGAGPEHKGEPALSYNRNQDTHAAENVARWVDFYRERPGTGERVNAGAVNIYFSDSNTHHRGAANYRCSGEVDPLRLPKEGFYAHQVMWDGWVDVERPRLHVIGHWNYPSGTRKPVQVVSSAETVELTLNGRSLGAGKRSDIFLFTWPEVAYEPGELRAVGKDAAGKVVCEQTIRTTGPAVALRLTAKTGPAGWRADGADLALVDVEVVDAQGAVVPTATHPVRFTLDGPAEWRGGIAIGPDNCILSKDLPVAEGINRAILRSRPSAGPVTVRAEAAGLTGASLKLETKAFAQHDGLATTMPDEGLRPSLTRGPTPAGESFKVSRRALRIVKSTAGFAPEQAALAYDDNEKTSWKNDGKRSTAWIEFELAEAADLTELTAKFGGWRTTSYPIKVTVDGKVAFAGATPKSLGYVTLPLKGAHGKTVRIELTGETTSKDEARLVEVTGEKLPDAKVRTSKGALQLMEVELYTKP